MYKLKNATLLPLLNEAVQTPRQFATKAWSSPSGRPRRFPAEISRVRTLCEFKIIREGNSLSRIWRIIAKKTTRLELFHSFKDQNKFPITQSILKYNLLRFLSPLPEHKRTFWPAAIKVDSWTLWYSTKTASPQVRHRFATYCGSRICRSFRFGFDYGEIEASIQGLVGYQFFFDPHLQ